MRFWLWCWRVLVRSTFSFVVVTRCWQVMLLEELHVELSFSVNLRELSACIRLHIYLYTLVGDGVIFLCVLW